MGKSNCAIGAIDEHVEIVPGRQAPDVGGREAVEVGEGMCAFATRIGRRSRSYIAIAGSLPLSSSVSRSAATRTLEPYFQACPGSASTCHVGGLTRRSSASHPSSRRAGRSHLDQRPAGVDAEDVDAARRRRPRRSAATTVHCVRDRAPRARSLDEPPGEIEQRDGVEQPEDAVDLQLHGQRDARSVSGTETRNSATSASEAGDEASLARHGDAGCASSPVDRDEQRRDSRGWGPTRRPATRPRTGSPSRQIAEPRRIHARQAARRAASTRAQCADGAPWRPRATSPRGSSRRVPQDRRGDRRRRKPERRGGMHDGRRERRRRLPRHGVCSRRQRKRAQSQRERQHARVHVALERVGAGLRDAMPQASAEPRNAADGRPRARRGACQRDALPAKSTASVTSRSRRTATGKSTRAERAAAPSSSSPSQSRICGVEHRRVAREQRRVGGERDRRHVERLVGHAVAIAAGVGRRQDDEERRRERPGRRVLRPRCWSAHIRSSAVGP